MFLNVYGLLNQLQLYFTYMQLLDGSVYLDFSVSSMLEGKWGKESALESTLLSVLKC